MPEASLVAILDADKEGFLRSRTSLIQTMGRAARNVNGRVIMYADNITGSMQEAIDETARRRKIQMQYNQEHGITPVSVKKDVLDVIDIRKASATVKAMKTKKMSAAEVQKQIATLEKEMLLAAKNLEFEHAAVLRDAIIQLKAKG